MQGVWKDHLEQELLAPHDTFQESKVPVHNEINIKMCKCNLKLNNIQVEVMNWVPEDFSVWRWLKVKRDGTTRWSMKWSNLCDKDEAHWKVRVVRKEEQEETGVRRKTKVREVEQITESKI